MIAAVTAKRAFAATLFCAAIWMGGAWRAESLPPVGSLEPTALPAPEQVLLEENSDDARSFRDERHGHQYDIKPRARFRMVGVVVSLSDAMSWRNITHVKIGDYLNTRDLCVVWGSTAANPFLDRLSFSHGDWTCYVQAHDMESWRAFKMDELSNTHFLPATAEVERVLSEVRIGDQIEAQGELVDYSTDGQPERKTSLIRSDTGNGACEILYAREIRILATPPGKWRVMEKLGFLGFMISAVALLASIFVMPFFANE